jgi:hypothetical protein
MLKNEAIWFGNAIKNIPIKKGTTILDLGSGGIILRNFRQPWINKYIFQQIKNRGGIIIHTNKLLDVCSKNFSKKITKMGVFDIIFATNLLEHVKNYKNAANNIRKIISIGGYLCVSCPREFPYHPDPIDNGLRPSLIELKNLFPKTKIINEGSVIEKTKIMFTKRRIFFNQKYSASCLILKK